MPRVLIMESEPLIAALIERGLRARNVVAWTSDGVPGAGVRADFDVVVIDDRSLQNGGAAILDHLASDGRWPQLIVLAGNGRTADTMSLLGSAPAYVLAKPFRLADLLAVVEGGQRPNGHADQEP